MIPQLLLLTGAPASGKTQLARRLLERYGACGCSKDEIKELLFDHLGERDAAWSGRLSDASFALLFAFAPRLLSARRLLVMEGNFRSGEHELALAAVLGQSEAEFAQILCRAEDATRAARLADRGTHSGRHPGHRDQDLPLSAHRRSDFLDLPGPRWVFSSDGEGDEEWQRLCGLIDRWHGEPPQPVHKQ
jgi:predicted kinase